MIIGICGKFGSGKSNFANFITLKDPKKYIHIDVDKIIYDIIKNRAIEINKDNYLDIKYLNKMYNLIQYYLEIEIDNIILKNKNRIIILDWQYLPITKYFEKCDITVLLDTSYEIRKQRCVERDKISIEQFDKRENICLDFSDIKFDYIIYDNKKILKKSNI